MNNSNSSSIVSKIIVLIILVLIVIGIYAFTTAKPAVAPTDTMTASSTDMTGDMDMTGSSTDMTSSSTSMMSATSTDISIASWKRILDKQAGFSYLLPPQFDQQVVSSAQAGDGTDNIFYVENKFYASINATGTIQTGWTIVSGRTGDGCSLVNESDRGIDATSTETTTVNGIVFYKVTSTGQGAGNVDRWTTYVQPVSDTACRYISFRNHEAADVASTNGGPSAQTNQIIATDAKIDNAVMAIMPKVVASVSLAN